MVGTDPVVVEERLRSGMLRCPGCGDGGLAPWGYARSRSVRHRDGRVEALRPQRGRCGACRGTHVLLPVTGHDDDKAHGLVRLICEDIANTPSEYDATALIHVLSTIDTLPVGYRTELGRFLLAALRSAADTTPDSVSWQFRIINRGLDVPLLGFGVCSRFDATVRAAFQSWVLRRHHERAPVGQLDRLDQALIVGVLLTPRSDGVRDWDTTVIAVSGDPQLTEQELTSSRALWNRSAEQG